MVLGDGPVSEMSSRMSIAEDHTLNGAVSCVYAGSQVARRYPFRKHTYSWKSVIEIVIDYYDRRRYCIPISGRIVASGTL